MRHGAVLLTAVLLLAATVFAQQTRPAWADGYFRELPNSYIEVVSGHAASPTVAREAAAQQLAERRNLTTGRHVQVKIEQGNITTEGGDEIVIKSRILDEYTHQLPSGEWEVMLLAQTARHPMYDFEAVHVSDRYPFSARALIPGMAQLHKGQTTKGLLFIGAEVIAVGGVITCEGLRSHNNSLSAATHNARLRMQYTNRAATCATARNLCIAGAASVYVWSLIDALTTRGKRQVILGDASLNLMPTFTSSEMGLLLTLNF